MAKDVGDLIGTAIGRVAKEAIQTVSQNKRRNGHSLGGSKGLAAGAGLAPARGRPTASASHRARCRRSASAPTRRTSNAGWRSSCSRSSSSSVS